MLIYVPLISALMIGFIMNGCWILPNAFFASVEIIMCFLPFFVVDVGVSHWLICEYWAILVTLGWFQLDHGAWSFLCVVGFSFLIFCGVFLHLYSSAILAYGFLFLVVSLSGFDIRVVVDSWNDFGSDPCSSMIWKCLRGISISSLYVWYFQSELLWSWPLFEGSFFVCLFCF